ncbi:substrate-binding periplasmic protein [Kordiimonas aestuarii]|uniref:substrate-binding periplasmic protein n=1 Tax=Kordiimonas aestuarii TaxID=1005925 RepID=UPI0021D2DF94|nr:transporter substrate-binding domain-containing protein [Kordiimonas aestuarii]
MASTALKIIALSGIFAFGSYAPLLACDAVLNVVYFNSAPYHYEKDDGTLTGLDVEILENVLTTAGCQWRYTKMPLKRSLSALRAGLADAAMGASITPERERYAYFSQAYRREMIVMFMRKENEAARRLKRISDVPTSNLRVGAHLGSWYGYEYARLFEQSKDFRNRVLQSVDYENLYRALLADRVDVVIDDIFNGHALLLKLGVIDQVDAHVNPVNDSLTHFMLSRKSVSTATIESIDHAIRAFQHSPVYKSIIAHYVPEEYILRYPLLSTSPAIDDVSSKPDAPTAHAR